MLVIATTAQSGISKRPPTFPLPHLIPALQLEVTLGQVQVERKPNGVNFLFLVRVKVEHLSRMSQRLGVARPGLAIVLALEKLGAFLLEKKWFTGHNDGICARLGMLQ